MFPRLSLMNDYKAQIKLVQVMLQHYQRNRIHIKYSWRHLDVYIWMYILRRV